MRSDVVAGNTFLDYQLPDHTRTLRKLSEIQGDDPLILTLARGIGEFRQARNGVCSDPQAPRRDRPAPPGARGGPGDRLPRLLRRPAGQLNRIIALKELGLSLAQVRRLLGGITLEELQGKLPGHKAALPAARGNQAGDCRVGNLRPVAYGIDGCGTLRALRGTTGTDCRAGEAYRKDQGRTCPVYFAKGRQPILPQPRPSARPCVHQQRGFAQRFRSAAQRRVPQAEHHSFPLSLPKQHRAGHGLARPASGHGSRQPVLRTVDHDRLLGKPDLRRGIRHRPRTGGSGKAPDNAVLHG